MIFLILFTVGLTLLGFACIDLFRDKLGLAQIELLIAFLFMVLALFTE